MRPPLLSQSHKEFLAAMTLPREQGIVAVGPFRRRNGTLVLAIGKIVLTEDEVLLLRKRGELSLAGIEAYKTRMANAVDSNPGVRELRSMVHSR
jgi:hypothetical protein